MYHNMRLSWKKIFYTVLVFGVLLVEVAFLCIYYHNSINSDLAGHFLSAYIAWEEHSLIPQGYNHTSTLGFESHIYLMHLFLAIFGSIKVSAILSSLCMLILFFISVYGLFRSFDMSKGISIVTSSLLMIPFNSIVLDMNVIGQYYLIQLVGAIITYSLFNYVKQVADRYKLLLCAAGCIISILESLNGSRYISLVMVPFAFLGFYQLYQVFSAKMRSADYSKECWRLIYLISVGAGAIFGYIIYSKVLTTQYSTYASSLGLEAVSDTKLFWERLTEEFKLFFSFWGLNLRGQNLGSIEGVVILFSLFFGIILMLIPFKIIANREKTDILAFAIFSLSALFSSFLLGSFFVNAGTLHVRYLYFAAYFLAFLFILYLWQIFKKGSYSFFNICAVFTLLFFGMGSFLQISKSLYDTYVIEKYSTVTIADQRDDVNNYLMQNGFDFGYATYWNANVATVLSEKRIDYCAIYVGDDSKLYPFMGGGERNNYNASLHTGKSFLLLTKDEYETVKNNLPAGGEKIYENDMFDVIGYEENAFDFSLELLQYFPLKNEEITLTEKDFQTTGNRANGKISIEQTGGFLVYGPAIKFPVDGIYDIEFSINILENAENFDIGYVAVTADAGTRILAREEIPNSSGSITVSLSDVEILSEDNAIEFPVYINPELTVEFERIKVVRRK